jgi:hypothetical protein
MHRMRKFAGGVLLAVVSPFAAAFGQTGSARIQGTIADSLRGGPLVGAMVVATPERILRDTVFHSAQTDDHGHFVLGNLRPGSYSVSVEHPVIDTTGIGAPYTAVSLHDSETANVFLAIPSVASLRRALCPLAVKDTTLGIMLGTVRRADGLPVATATVVFVWTDFDVYSATATVRSRELYASARADSVGTYRACGLPVQRSVFVQAQGDADSQSGIVEEKIGATGVLLRDFRIGNSAELANVTKQTVIAASDSAASSPGSVISGKVTTLSGSAISSAQVSLIGGSRSTTTNDQGEFRIAGVTAGTQGLHVIALGYYPQMLRVEVSGAASAPVQVRMENAAVVLDSMRIIAKRATSRLRLAHRDFDRRRESGGGTYLTAKEIEALQPSAITDIFRHVSGVHLAEQRGPFDALIVSNRGPVEFGATVCPLDIFLDGTRVLPQEVNMVAPEVVYGIEVVSVANAPVKYKIGRCGAVFLWTK